MEITNELLAAYVEGNISLEERKEIRKYLTEHPSQLESVMLMMDKDDYFEDESKVIIKSPSNKIECLYSDKKANSKKNVLCNSIGTKVVPQRKKDFNHLINEILNEIDT